MRAINAGKLRDGGVLRELNRQANGRERVRARVVSSKNAGAASIAGRTSSFSESLAWPRTSVFKEQREYTSGSTEREGSLPFSPPAKSLEGRKGGAQREGTDGGIC
jgi:hypothetical protein